MAIMSLPLDDTADFLISGDYIPLPITPPSTSGDKARYHAISRQLDFSALMVTTQISGLPPTDWFTQPIKRVPSTIYLPPSVNDQSWAHMILHGGIVTDNWDILHSPVRKFTADSHRT